MRMELRLRTPLTVEEKEREGNPDLEGSCLNQCSFCCLSICTIFPLEKVGYSKSNSIWVLNSYILIRNHILGCPAHIFIRIPHFPL